MSSDRRRGERSAFTLIEMLVVITIIALLVTLLLPTVKRAKAQGRDAQCKSLQRQILYATQLYAEDYKVTPLATDQSDWSHWNNDWHQRIRPYFSSIATDMMCPSYFHFIRTHHPSDAQYKGYHPTLWLTGRRYPDLVDQHVRWHLITSPSASPWLTDSNGLEQSNPYGHRPGRDLSDPSSKSTNLKFRHDGSLNLVMVDGHVESQRGQYIGELGWQPNNNNVLGVTIDNPRQYDAFYREASPYVWHSPDAPEGEYPRGYAFDSIQPP